MDAKKLASIIGLGLLLVGGIFLKSRTETSAQPVVEAKVSSSVANPDFVQIDYQNGAKVVATYLPEKSSPNRATVRIDLAVDTGPIGSYDFSQKVVWADTNIDPLPTVSTNLLSSSENTESAQMTFFRTRGSHYHLLVKDFVGIKNRVVHFYL